MSESSTTYWQSLLPAAMVGTEKMAFTAPRLAGAVGDLLAQIGQQTDAPARALLQSAGVLAVCERASQQGQASTAPTTTEAAAPETEPALSSDSLKITLRWALTEAPARLQIELLQRLKAAGLRLPNGLLPLALEAGQRSVALRPALLPVLGERGRWLGRQNSAWRYAEGTAALAPLEARWSEGSLAQRALLLREERQRDADSARERLKAALPDLPAKERSELVAVLAEGLSMQDEELLAGLASKDRGSEVRQIARALLVQLPESAQTQRAVARLLPCLEKKSMLAGLIGGKWKIEPPQAAGDDWKADGLEAERPKYESLGERAWWLYQLARQLPLVWWTSHTGMTPDALLLWARKGDWADALARAWFDVLRMTPDTLWCKAFLDHWPGKSLGESRATVLALLPASEREPYWTQMLEQVKPGKAGNVHEVTSQMAQACPPGEHVSLALSVLLLEKLPLYLKQSYYMRALLAEVCCVLHPATLPSLLALPPPPEDAKETPAHALAQAVQDNLQAISARHAFLNLSASV
ncbi:hypothetical protein RCH06_001516 [Polaromonas sp. CG_9.5]|uniref:DUF5691 domain-containing protein n=1 Tax=Polaromonas sp. CG_9.5 TaxID=3071705 RepID=UPI002E078C75|nr:hypothetical protein [Polaromonas sp. CG_9.5]